MDFSPDTLKRRLLPWGIGLGIAVGFYTGPSGPLPDMVTQWYGLKAANAWSSTATRQPAVFVDFTEDRVTQTATTSFTFTGPYPGGQTRNYEYDASDDNAALFVGIECVALPNQDCYAVDGNGNSEYLILAGVPADSLPHTIEFISSWTGSDTTTVIRKDGVVLGSHDLGFAPSFSGDFAPAKGSVFPPEGYAPAAPAGSAAWIPMSVPGMFASLSATATTFFGHSQWEGFWLTIFVAAAIMVGVWAVNWLISKIRRNVRG